VVTRPAATFGVGMLAGAFLAAAGMFFAQSDIRPATDCQTVLVMAE